MERATQRAMMSARKENATFFPVTTAVPAAAAPVGAEILSADVYATAAPQSVMRSKTIQSCTPSFIAHLFS